MYRTGHGLRWHFDMYALLAQAIQLATLPSAVGRRV
jgi:hypothetical protein